jgi:outer-membrane receptor for ferric coprogen and ferric-rhodotorulic acid
MDYYSHKRAIVYRMVEADVTPTTMLRGGIDYQKYHAQDSPGVPVLYSDGTRTNLPRFTSSGAIGCMTGSTLTPDFLALEQSISRWTGWGTPEAISSYLASRV